MQPGGVVSAVFLRSQLNPKFNLGLSRLSAELSSLFWDSIGVFELYQNKSPSDGFKSIGRFVNFCNQIF